MAARRILSLLAAKVPGNPVAGGVSRTFHRCPNSFPHAYQLYTRLLTTLTESSQIQSTNTPQQLENESPHSKLKISDRHDMVMVFTCKVCETRSMKTACRESYDKGVVVVRCDGCNNLHLIADRLGWFGEPGSVEDLLAARGEQVKKDTLNFTLEDLVGEKNSDA